MSSATTTRPETGLTLGRANLEEFGATLLAMGQAHPNLRVVTSDSRGSGKLVPFSKTLPNQIVEVGVAEQNLVGIAAGLAAAGKAVFAVSPACFLTARALEQIKNDVCYSDHPVKLVGISAGVSYGALGSTHHSLHDFAVLRAIHNIAIVAPADNWETRAALHAALDYPGPVYLRFGKRPMPHLHGPASRFEIGKAITVSEPETGASVDVTFIATGEAVAPARQAVDMLALAGLSCRVISMHTVKPLDTAALFQAAQRTRCLITVEEHSVYGGLGGACAEVYMQGGVSIPFRIVAIPDEYTVTGSQQDIFNYYGITPEGLTETARQLLGLPNTHTNR
jgi:transketolase